MEDLSDGVNKLTEFSAVLSSVTRTLDKNVRRLEDQFGKCNDSLKKMDETVAESSKIANALKEENEAQVLALQDAVAKATHVPDHAPLSEFMLTKEEFGDIRPKSLVLQEEEENKDAVAHTEKEAKLYSEIQPWSRLVDGVLSSDKIYSSKALNAILHKQNKSLRVAPRAEVKEGVEGPETAVPATPEGAFPFPEIKEGDGVGPALSAMIQRMHRLENAVNLQTNLNEALVRMVRDDTQMKAMYDTVAGTVNVIHSDLREIGIGQAKIRSTLKGLGDFVHDYELKMQDVAPDGRLRVESRRERGAKDEDGVAIEGEVIEYGLDAYTVAESDRLDRRITGVESQLSANGAMGVALRRLDSTCEELQSQMMEREEEIAALKKFQEENSSATFLLKRAIIASQERWETALADISFGLHDYTEKNLMKVVEDDGDDEEKSGDEEEEEEEDEDEDDGEVESKHEEGAEESSPSRPKKKQVRLYDDDPIMITKLRDLFNAIEGVKNGSIFAIHDNLDDTLDVLCPALDDLTLRVEEIFALDTELRLGENNSIDDDASNPPPVVILAELLTEVRKYNLKEVLFEAAKSSVPIIDERVDKITLRRRIEKIEGEAVHKKDIDFVSKKQEEMSARMKDLTSKEEMGRVMGKTAKKTDLQRFRDVMFQRLDLNENEIQSLNTIVEEHWEHTIHDDADIHALAFSSDSSGNKLVGKSTEYGNQRAGSPNVSFGNAPRFGGGGASSEEVKEMSTRVDLIFNQFKDLQTTCEAFIPREEVQEALKATLYELKLLKMNTINVNKFNEEIEKKADYDEMKSLMEVLSSALGDLMGKNVSAAAKSRCLLCDKPVSSAARESRGRSSSPSRPHGDRDSPNRSPLEMANNNRYDHEEASSRPGTSQPRLSSSKSASVLPTPKDAARAKARITSEVTLLKNSMELPAIDSGTPQARPPGMVNDQYKSRVRSSAGGGNVMY